MDLFNKLIHKLKPNNPEDNYVVTITSKYIRVEHPQHKTEQVLWESIHHIKIINTDEGPWLPDIWLALIGPEDGCLIPQGAKGFEEVYSKISKYEGFNLENFTKSMSCTHNAEFDLWLKI